MSTETDGSGYISAWEREVQASVDAGLDRTVAEARAKREFPELHQPYRAACNLRAMNAFDNAVGELVAGGLTKAAATRRVASEQPALAKALNAAVDEEAGLAAKKQTAPGFAFRGLRLTYNVKAAHSDARSRAAEHFDIMQAWDGAIAARVAGGMSKHSATRAVVLESPGLNALFVEACQEEAHLAERKRTAAGFQWRGQRLVRVEEACALERV